MSGIPGLVVALQCAMPASYTRRLLERWSRHIVFPRRLPAEFGRERLWVSPAVMLRLWRPRIADVDPRLLRAAKEFVARDSVIWDIGSNVGLFTVAAAHRAGPGGHVVAVEADTWLVNLLRRSAACGSQDSAPITVIPAAVADRVDLAEFHIAARGRAANFLSTSGGSSQAGGTRETQRVISITLDWLLERVPAPGLVKIDVEGAEFDVLSGAERLLADVRPTVLCEVDERNGIKVGDIFRRHDYILHDSAAPDREIPNPVWDTLARPR